VANPADEGDEDELTKKLENETALFLNLHRSRIITLFNIFQIIWGMAKIQLRNLCKLLSSGLSLRLDSYKVNKPSDASKTSTTEGSWNKTDERLCRLTAGCIDEGLQFIFAIVANKLRVSIRRRR
jgi:hypothetical protein